MKQATIIAHEMTNRGWLKQMPDANLLNLSTQIAVEEFDRSMRDLSRRRQLEYRPQLADDLLRVVYDQVINRIHLLRQPTEIEQNQIISALRSHGLLIADLPRPEEVDLLLDSFAAS
jgi:hypothetical protein